MVSLSDAILTFLATKCIGIVMKQTVRALFTNARSNVKNFKMSSLKLSSYQRGEPSDVMHTRHKTISLGQSSRLFGRHLLSNANLDCESNACSLCKRLIYFELLNISDFLLEKEFSAVGVVELEEGTADKLLGSVQYSCFWS